MKEKSKFFCETRYILLFLLQYNPFKGLFWAQEKDFSGDGDDHEMFRLWNFCWQIIFSLVSFLVIFTIEGDFLFELVEALAAHLFIWLIFCKFLYWLLK